MMYKVTILYPVKAQDRFDMDYYIREHVPLSRSVFGSALKGLAIETAADTDNTVFPESPYKVIGHLFFEKVADFYDNFLPNQALLEADASRYTNVPPEIQISKVIMWEHFASQ